MRGIRLRRWVVLAAAAALAASGVGLRPFPLRAQDPAPPPADPKKPAPPPLDADLDPERDILREAKSDPRNLKPDAIPPIKNPVYVEALAAQRMDPEEWVIGAVIGKTTLAFPVNVLNQHEILLDTVDQVPFMVCW
jgi:hypothetical protein